MVLSHERARQEEQRNNEEKRRQHAKQELKLGRNYAGRKSNECGV